MPRPAESASGECQRECQICGSSLVRGACVQTDRQCGFGILETEATVQLYIYIYIEVFVACQPRDKRFLLRMLLLGFMIDTRRGRNQNNSWNCSAL